MRLAAPVVASRAGFLTMLLVDLAVLGRLSAGEVARFALGMSPSVVLMLVGVGLLFGGVVVIAQAKGEGQLSECGLAWRRSVPYALILGLVMAALLSQTEGLLLLLGQAPALAAGAGPVGFVFSIGMPLTLLYFANAFLLESLKRPGAVLMAVLGSNLLNLALTPLAVMWLPDHAAEAAAAMTVISRGAAGVALLIVIRRQPDRQMLGLTGSFLAPGWWRGARAQRRHGYAAGLSQGAESAAFNAMMLFAGWIGETALAAYASAINLMATMFMVAVGLATATAVQVAQAHGARDWRERRAAGWTGAGLVSLILGGFALLLLSFPDAVAAFYTTDVKVIETLVPLLLLAAAALVADGLQVVLNQSCRAAGDAWVPTWLAMFSYMVVMLPAGYSYAFLLDMGATGLFAGILTASMVSALVLCWRWIVLSARAMRLA